MSNLVILEARATYFENKITGVDYVARYGVDASVKVIDNSLVIFTCKWIE